MTAHTAVEADVLFDISAFLEERSVRQVKNIFINAPFTPQFKDINRFYIKNTLEDQERLQTEGLGVQEVDKLLKQAYTARHKATVSSIETTWNIFKHLAENVPDEVFKEYLVRGLPLWDLDYTNRRMHSVMRYVYYVLYKYTNGILARETTIRNFTIKNNSAYLYEVAEALIKNKNFKKLQKKSENLKNTLLGNSGIKNIKKIQNFKKKNIFFLYSIVDLEVTVKDDYLVQKLCELCVHNSLNHSLNNGISELKAFMSVMENTIDRQGGLFDSKHDLDVNINNVRGSFEVNGIAEMLSFSGKPFISANLGDQLVHNSPPEINVPNNDNDSSYHTAKPDFKLGWLDTIFNWFTKFNYDHVFLLSIGTGYLAARLSKDSDSVIKKTLAVILLACGYYLTYLHLKKMYDFMTSFPDLSNETCDYLFNSNISKMIFSLVTYIAKLSGRRFMPVVVNEDMEVHMEDLPESTCIIEELEEQASVKDSPLRTVVMCLISFFTARTSMGVKPGAVDYVMSFLWLRDSAVNNVTTIIQTAMTVMQDLFNYLFNTEVNFLSVFDIERYSSEKAKKFCETVSERLVGYHTGAKEIDSFSHEVFVEDVAEGNKILKSLDRGSYDYTRIVTLLREYEKLAIQNKVTMKSLSGTRIEPVGLLLRGPPSTKKTVALDRIAKMATKFTIPKGWRKEWEENPDAFMFNIPTDKFWDTYTYKAWTAVADDLFQQRDQAGAEESEALKIIKMINCNPYVLQMADVSLKNTKFFRSAFVMATTNLMDFNQLESIRDPRAAARRFHLTLDVSVNPKYMGHTCYNDPITFGDSEIMGNVLPDDYWIFKHEGNVVSMTEVIKTLVALYQTHIADYLSNIRATYDSVSSMEEDFGDGIDMFSEAFVETMTDPSSLFSRIKSSSEKYLEKQSGCLNNEPTTTYIHCTDSSVPITLSQHFAHHRTNFTSDFTSKTGTRCLVQFLDFKDNLMKGRLSCVLIKLRREDVIKFINLVDIPHLSYETLYNLSYESFSLSSAEVNEVVYATGEKLIIDIEKLAEFYVNSHVTGYNKLVEEEVNVQGYMDRCLRFCRETIEGLLRFVSENIFLIIAASTAGFVILKIFQKILKAFSVDSELVDIDLEELEKQDDSPTRCTAKSKSKAKPKHVKKSEYFRDNERVNWEGKPDNRRGNRLKKVGRKGLSLDGFDTSILGKIATDQVDVINHSDVVSKVLNKYYFIVYVRNKKTDNLRKLGQSINVVSNIFIMPDHFFDSIENYTSESIEDFEVIMTTCTKRLVYRIPAYEFMELGYATETSVDRDLSYVVVPHAQMNSCGALKYIANTQELDSLKNRKLIPSVLVGVSLTQGGNSITCKKFGSSIDSTSFYVRSDSDGEPGYIISNTVSYSSNTAKGDCGSLLVREENLTQSKCIFGMHIAGYGEKGVSAILNSDDIDYDLKSLGFNNFGIMEDEMDVMDGRLPMLMESQSGVHKVLELPSQLAAPVPFATDLKRSKFYGNLPSPYDRPSTLPARLRPFFNDDDEYIDPYQNGLLNYGKDQVCIPSHICSHAAMAYSQDIKYSTVDYGYDVNQPIPLQEALHGFRGVGPIMSSTSAGWPLSIDKNNMKKRYYSPNSTYEEKSQAYFEIEEEIKFIISKYEDGVRPNFFYTDCLKDEKVSIEKCHLGKTRIFSACPFTLLVLFRMYFGAFMDAFISSNLDVGSAIGVNPYSAQWSYLVHRLSVHGKDKDGNIYVGAGDYSKFDGHEQPYLLNMVYRIISDWYGYKNVHCVMMRKYLWAEITNSRHIHGNEVYEWFASMPSGNPLTSLINTMYNNLAFRVAWILAGNAMCDFNDNVYIAAMGDDNIFSVSEPFRDNFNELKLPELMRKVGMVYTTEIKSEATSAFRPITEVEFLKRSFAKDVRYNRWIAPLRFSAIIEILNWTKKSKSDEIAVDNVGLVLREISLHGKSKYDEWYSVLDTLLKKHYPDRIPKGIYTSDFKFVYREVLNTDNFMY